MLLEVRIMVSLEGSEKGMKEVFGILAFQVLIWAHIIWVAHLSQFTELFACDMCTSHCRFQ